MALRILSIMIACSLAQSAFARESDETAALSIKIDSAYGTVPHNFIGSNINSFLRNRHDKRLHDKGGGVWDPILRRPMREFVEAATEAGIRSFRWPGGINAEYFAWETAIGPLKSRPKQRFGLPEYLLFCETVQADPLITLPTGSDKAESAANLVEYLNAPADGRNPNGGVDWAKARERDGRTEPWGVAWFEYGNETYNASSGIVVEDYIDGYRKTQDAMKAVDPEIRLGAQFAQRGLFKDGWTREVIDSLGDRMDFSILHVYMPSLPKKAIDEIDQHTVAAAAMSVDADLSYRLRRLQAAMAEIGAGDTPLIVSEFNGGFPQDEPLPYRFTLFNAVHNAEMLRIMMNPEYKIAMTNYWTFANTHWGLVLNELMDERGFVKQADQLMLEILHRYRGDTLISHKIESSSFEFDGALGISSRKALDRGAANGQPFSKVRQVGGEWKLRRRLNSGFDLSQADGVVTVNFNQNRDVNFFHAYRPIAVEPDSRYRVTTQLRARGVKGGKVGVIVEDARGWQHNFHQEINVGVAGTTPGWMPVSVEFQTLYDTEEIHVVSTLR